jgi:hypothetical protein
MLKAFLLPFAALSLVVCCCAASASAGTLVPPGNSAANQYTETFPTSKGEEDAQGKKKSGVTPAQVLGAGKAHQLEDKGQTGKAVADFAAETSPAVVDSSTEAGSDTGNGKPDKSKGNPNGNKKDSGGPSDDEEGSESSGGAGGGQTPSAGSGTGAASSGSSSLGEIASQATGTSAGSVGLWLPLILIAVVIWSAAYVWRNRQQRVV